MARGKLSGTLFASGDLHSSKKVFFLSSVVGRLIFCFGSSVTGVDILVETFLLQLSSFTFRCGALVAFVDTERCGALVAVVDTFADAFSL